MRAVLIGAALSMSACSPVSSPSNVNLCDATVRAYAHLRDEGPAEHYADLFTQDGEFHLGPNVTKGRDALISRHIASNADNVWRHNMTDIRIRENHDGLSGVTRFHIFAGPKGEKPSAPTREILGDYLDEFAIENGACKIASRKVKITFDTLN